MSNPIERRTFDLDRFEIRENGDGMPTLVGHAALFNNLSVDLGGFRETINRGAFANSLDGDVRALFNHNPDAVLGRTVASTLRLREDSVGLAVEIDPPDTQVARDLITSMRRGDISQMSFGFRVLDAEWAEADDDLVRILKEVKLFDVSPVTFAAYPDTDVAVRSLEAWKADRAPPADENLPAVDESALRRSRRQRRAEFV